jgi:hypothetical protein
MAGSPSPVTVTVTVTVAVAVTVTVTVTARECDLCFIAVSCNTFCSVCVCVHLCSLVYSLLLQLYGFVSFYTQLRLILLIYWSSPLCFNKLLISVSAVLR